MAIPKEPTYVVVSSRCIRVQMMVKCRRTILFPHRYVVHPRSLIMNITGYNLVVKRPIDLVALLIERLCGNDQISLEGDLRYVDTRQFPSPSSEPTPLLPRNTTQPTQNFMLLAIEADTKERLLRVILPQAGLRKRIYHLQIQKDSERLFAAYDGFHPDCVWIGAWVE